jgi:hypothetical protein
MDDIKRDLGDTGWGCVEWIGLVRERVTYHYWGRREMCIGYLQESQKERSN